MYTCKILYTQQSACGAFQRTVNLDTERFLDDESALEILKRIIPTILLATVLQTLEKEEIKYAA